MTEQSPLLCHTNNSQLLLIDIQTRLSNAMPTESRAQVLNNSAILTQAAEILDIPTIITRQYPKGLGETEATLSQHTTEAMPVLDKTGFSCCLAEGFDTTLATPQRHQVIITGMESHVCVLQTALDLHHQGYQAFVVEDAVCSRRQSHHANAMARLRQAGAIITNVESVLFEWLRDARHEQFKTLSALIR